MAKEVKSTMGLLSLVVYWWADSQYGPLWGAVAGVAGSLLEALWEKRSRGKVAPMTWAGLILVVFMGVTSWACEREGMAKAADPLSAIFMGGFLIFLSRGQPPRLFRWMPEFLNRLSQDEHTRVYQVALMTRQMFRLALAVGFFGVSSLAVLLLGIEGDWAAHYREYGLWVLIAAVFFAPFVQAKVQSRG